MIILDVQDYCQYCKDFDADVEKPKRVLSGDGNVLQTDTIIRCDNRNRCEGIKRYLERQQKNPEGFGLFTNTCPAGI